MSRFPSKPMPCKLPPLRTLDDFLLSSARFQVPNFQDLDKWGNRVTKNLLYYQTNYCVLTVMLYVLFAFMSPTKTIAGVGVIAAVCYVFTYLYADDDADVPILETVDPRYKKWMIMGVVVLFSWLLLTVMDAVLYMAFAALVPFGLSFIHASLRLRNIRNKMSSTIESLGVRETPMGCLLAALSITADEVIAHIN